MDELIPIGRFARMAGLSVGALRHYDELDLLRPADVDTATAYRRYRADQLETARTIGTLRELEVPLDGIRAVLAADDPAERRRLLDAHRARIDARTVRLRRISHALHHLTEGKEAIVPDRPLPDPALDAATERALAVDLFNRVWSLLETPDRTPAQVDEMIHAAHASRHHWAAVGTAANLARGEWQCSRVYATLGRGEPALWHARRCVAILEESAIADWDIAAGYEAMARACAIAGDLAAARAWAARAQAACDAIEEDEDRRIVQADLDGLVLD
ncbi:MAG: helix-turn-helix domain-containing protein [Chloroflexi bacterium]|jgi:DNA-binding transcriptional MerR regulator|nr:helix-turn-helix domain-containing protein [Chloroflexota bacterium]